MENDAASAADAKVEFDLCKTQALIHIVDDETKRFDMAQKELYLIKNQTSKAITDYRKYKNSHGTIFYIIIAILVFVALIYCWSPIVSVINYFVPELTEKIFSNMLLGGVFVVFPPVIVCAIIMTLVIVKTKTKTKKLKSIMDAGVLTPEETSRCEFCEKVMANATENLIPALSSLKKSILPKDYHNVYAVDWIVKAIENKRADNLKEAINLYEKHMVDEQMRQELSSVYDAVANIKPEVNNYYW